MAADPPVHVAPLGAALAGAGPGAAAAARRSLGALAALPDAGLVTLLSLLDGPSIARLALASRGCWALAEHGEAWRGATLADFGGDWAWAGSWARTHGLAHIRRRSRDVAGKKRRRHDGDGDADALASTPYPRLRGFRLFSDQLFAPHAVTALDSSPWLGPDTLLRVRAAALTRASFEARFDAPGLPVLLVGGAAGWPALTRWTDAFLAARLGAVHAAGVDLSWSTYRRYALATADDAPLTVFDARVLDATGLASDAGPPACAPADLLELLPPAARPDARWLIVGPPGSGSCMHTDPNGTSVWNGVVRGRKKWVLFPPGRPPPGLSPSPDGATVVGPATVREWLAAFHAGAAGGPPGERPLEGVAGPGDVVFVPRGWWHCVLNLEGEDDSADVDDLTIAVTSNFVSRAGLPTALRALRTRDPGLVSGVPLAARASLVDAFEAALRAGAPGALADADAAAAKAGCGGAAALFREAAPDGGAGFAFGFDVGAEV